MAGFVLTYYGNYRQVSQNAGVRKGLLPWRDKYAGYRGDSASPGATSRGNGLMIVLWTAALLGRKTSLAFTRP